MIELADGESLGFDDVGDPEGVPVVYLHGTPDSRVARHPDDSVVVGAGVRLIAVDRAGYGGTDVGVGARVVEAVLEGLGIERAGVIAWSGGALDGVRAALGTERVSELHLIAGLVPVEAYEDPEIRDAASGRLDLIEVVEAYGAGKVAAMLAPCPCDRELALEYQREQRDPVEQARLAAIPGAVERMAEALVEGVRNGLGGVEADIKAQVRPLGGLPTETPTHLWYGTEDHIAPLAFGRWYAEHLPNSELHVVEDAGHFLPFTHWEEILGSVSRGLRGTAPLG